MKLLSFTPVGKSPELFNTDNIKFSYPDGTGTKFTYDYFGKPLSFRISESYESFLAFIEDSRGLNVENLILSVLGIDGVAFDTQIHLALKWVVRGEPNVNGTLLYCHGKAISNSDKAVVIQVAESVANILTLQAPTAPLSVSLIEAGEYTLVIGDAEKYIRFNDASAISVAVPLNADVPFPIGTTITLEQSGEGVITAVADAVPVTLNGGPSSAGQYKAISLLKVEEDTWTCIGGVTNE